jgi:EAL domain-containing protein (putative c-di-GMP-specific phosphodiesterase class I)
MSVLGVVRRSSQRQSAPAPWVVVGATFACVGALALGRLAVDDLSLVDTLQQFAAIAIALALLGRGVRGSSGMARHVCTAQAVSIVVGSVGMIVWDLAAINEPGPPLITEVTLVAAAGLMLVAPLPAVFRGLDKRTLAGLALDGITLLLGATAVVWVVWTPDVGYFARANELPAVAAAVMLVAAAAGMGMVLVARRVWPSNHGPWLVATGMFLLGASWIAWLDLAARGQGGAIGPGDFIFSLGVILLAYGSATWTSTPRPSRRIEAVTAKIGDGFPLLAVVVSVYLELLPGELAPGPAIAAAGVVLAAVARMALLIASERAARDAEIASGARLASEMRERSETAASLANLEPAGSIEETAQRVCDHALQLRGIEVAIVKSVGLDGRIVPIALAGLDVDRDAVIAQPLPAARAAMICEQAAEGAWIEIVGRGDADAHVSELQGAGLLALANAPIRWDDRLVGLVSLGARSPEVAATLAGRLPTVREFGVVAGALLGPELVAREKLRSLRAHIAGIIDTAAFHPVFQPVVELASGRVVGFEALSRFDDGTRPDLRFREAQEAGMSVELETTTLRAVIAESKRLPEGRWLSLNVSPALATALTPLIAALEGAGRDVVLEITEHVPIKDYRLLAVVLETLRGHVRIAVDDAGAGYASLRHILELQPDFVKLDIGLVRSVDSDPARRAMVASMVSFARDTDCSIIAEGIETEGEREALKSLGVQLGQGYLLGRPARI